jgi:DNA-binding CsgD family transcriptional regulator
MRSVDARVADWVGFVGDLLRNPLREMPHDQIFDQLRASFAVAAVSVTWYDGRTVSGDLMDPPDALASLAAEMREWHLGEWRDCHALTTWYEVTGDPRPTTWDRVPTTIVSAPKRQQIERRLRPLDLNHQLAVNVSHSGRAYQTYVLGRGRLDFSDADLVVAEQIQPVLIGLDRQVRVLREASDRSVGSGELDLTGRELAVLVLIAAGYPTRIAARRLHCSPRTVEKHLERIYRKLGVRDRLNAVLRARRLGILEGPSI